MSTAPAAADGSLKNSSEADGQEAAGGGQPKLKERHKPLPEEAFQQDVEQYLSTGYLQIAQRRGSMSSMEVNVDMLEQMDLMDMSDHEALDVFLHSGGEDNSVASPVTGPESLSADVSPAAPTPAELRHKMAALRDRRDGRDDRDDGDGEDEGRPEEAAVGGALRRRRRKRAPAPPPAPDV